MSACKILLSKLKSKYPENYEQLALLVQLHPELCERYLGDCDDSCPRKITNQLNTGESTMSELQEYQFRADSAEAELKRFKEQQARDEKNRRVKEFKDQCEVLVKSGQMAPADRDQLINNIDESGRGVSWAAFKKFIENRGTALNLHEYGLQGDNEESREYTSAADELAARAKTYSRKNNVSYEQASEIVLSKDSNLAERYKMEDV